MKTIEGKLLLLNCGFRIQKAVFAKSHCLCGEEKTFTFEFGHFFSNKNNLITKGICVQG